MVIIFGVNVIPYAIIVVLGAKLDPVPQAVLVRALQRQLPRAQRPGGPAHAPGGRRAGHEGHGRRQGATLYTPSCVVAPKKPFLLLVGS